MLMLLYLIYGYQSHRQTIMIVLFISFMLKSATEHLLYMIINLILLPLNYTMPFHL